MGGPLTRSKQNQNEQKPKSSASSKLMTKPPCPAQMPLTKIMPSGLIVTRLGP
jgi:hypothetical protein